MTWKTPKGKRTINRAQEGETNAQAQAQRERRELPQVDGHAEPGPGPTGREEHPSAPGGSGRPRSLSDKQEAFAVAYVGEAAGNATEAASLAKYRGNRRTLEAVGRQNLAKPRIAERIAELRAELAEDVVSVEEIVDEVRGWLYANLAEYVDFRPGAGLILKCTFAELPARVQRCVVEVSETKWGLRIKLVDKVAAADKLMRHLGGYNDKVTHDVGPTLMDVIETIGQSPYSSPLKTLRAKREAENDERVTH